MPSATRLGSETACRVPARRQALHTMRVGPSGRPDRRPRHGLLSSMSTIRSAITAVCERQKLRAGAFSPPRHSTIFVGLSWPPMHSKGAARLSRDCADLWPLDPGPAGESDRKVLGTIFRVPGQRKRLNDYPSLLYSGPCGALPASANDHRRWISAPFRGRPGRDGRPQGGRFFNPKPAAPADPGAGPSVPEGCLQSFKGSVAAPTPRGLGRYVLLNTRIKPIEASGCAAAACSERNA